MPGRFWVALAVCALIVIGAAACTNDEAPTDGGSVGTEGVPVAPMGGATEGTAEEGAAPVGMFASGSATPPPRSDATDPVRPAPETGIVRAVSVDEARQAVNFTLQEPTDLPENTYLTIVQLIEAGEEKAEPGLPAVRLIYDIDSLGVIVLHQSPATGQAAEGEAITVAGQPATLAELSNAMVVTWEAGGVRFEMRGSKVSREVLLAAAESLAPSGTGSDTSGASGDEGDSSGSEATPAATAGAPS